MGEFSFKPLWKVLIDKGMSKEALRKALGLSHSTIARMGKGEPASFKVLGRICEYLDVGVADVVEYIPAKVRVIFDNGGGVTLQLGKWAHYYDDPAQAARDYAEYFKDGTAAGWEGHEDEAAECDPTYDEIRNGGYRVYNAGEILDEIHSDDSTGWDNIDSFCLAQNSPKTGGK
jgi:DNA-binding Xre family transcriptional regulator